MEVLHAGLKQAASKLNVAAFTLRGSTKIKGAGSITIIVILYRTPHTMGTVLPLLMFSKKSERIISFFAFSGADYELNRCR